MKKTPLIVLLLCFLAACIFGCETTKRDRIDEFTNEFNEIAPAMRGGTFRSVYLEEEGTDSVKVNFVLNSIADQTDKHTLQKTAASLAYQTLKNVTKLQELADSGVAIRIVFISSDSEELANSFLDKKDFKYLEATAPEKNRTAKTARQKPTNDTAFPETKAELLEILNRNVPQKDPESGATMMGFEVDSQNVMVAKIMVTDDVAKQMRSPFAHNAVRQNLSSSPDIKSMIEDVRKFEIYKVRYEYFDQKGAFLLGVELTREDVL